MKKKRQTSGIRKRYLKYTIGLLSLALLLSSIGVGVYVTEIMTNHIMKNYEFVNTKRAERLSTWFSKSDQVLADCILSDQVQDSLKNNDTGKKNVLNKYFAYIDFDYFSEFCYVDNKENVYARPYTFLNYDTFRKSGLQQQLGDSYAKTRWIWTKDTLFGTGRQALFIGRKVHSLDYAKRPGYLLFMANKDFLDSILTQDESKTKDAVTGIMSENGEVCCLRDDTGTIVLKNNQKLLQTIAKSDQTGLLVANEKVKDGRISVYKEPRSNMLIFTLVPNQVFTQASQNICIVLAIIYLFVILLAVFLSLYFSKKFSKPIQKISSTMLAFDGSHFDHTIDLHTDTELDQIGESYNKMLVNIRQLLDEIKDQQKELRMSEVNALISQMNPHFLYNTLDTIYMLARINKEETTMRMIEALSKYLRLSLSKGNDVVTVADEIENVKSYLQIQLIRNADLFEYHIRCDIDPDGQEMIKLILQPLVENAIKYGFCDIYEGGIIDIHIWKEEERLLIDVYNNGNSIDTAMCQKINELVKAPLSVVRNAFPDKKRGYGVVNIITRLRLEYGDDIEFYYRQEEEGTTCHIELPDRS